MYAYKFVMQERRYEQRMRLALLHFVVAYQKVLHQLLNEVRLWRNVAAARNQNRHVAIPPCVFSVYATKHKGVYLLYRALVYPDVLLGYVFYVGDRFCVIYGLKVFTHRLPCNRYALVHHKLRLLQR